MPMIPALSPRPPPAAPAALLFALGLAGVLAAGETGPSTARWPAWRGPDGTGCAASGSSYPVRFSADEGLAWKVELPGIGRSTPVVWDPIRRSGTIARRER